MGINRKWTEFGMYFSVILSKTTRTFLSFQFPAVTRVSHPSPALPKEYQRIGKAFQNLSSVFTSSGYQGTTVPPNTSHAVLTAPPPFPPPSACFVFPLNVSFCRHTPDCSIHIHPGGRSYLLCRQCVEMGLVTQCSDVVNVFVLQVSQP